MNLLKVAFLALLICVPAFGQVQRESKSHVERCEAVDGIDLLTSRARSDIIIFGEFHGTVESPKLIADALCELVRRDIPLRFGFEAFSNLTEPLNNAFASSSDPLDVLEATEQMWTMHDGRSSEAIFGILTNFLSWKQSGADIEVFTFDARFEDFTSSPSNVERSRIMARNVDAAMRGFDGAVVLITGKNHAELGHVQMFDPQGKLVMAPSMAELISERPVFSIGMEWGKGSAWVWGPDGPGVIEIEASDHADGGRMGIHKTSETETGFRARYYFDAVTPSPPAYRPAN